jgi:hypothetical protein
MLDEALLTKLLCVGFVAAFMLPFGGLLFPYVSSELSGIEPGDRGGHQRDPCVRDLFRSRMIAPSAARIHRNSK